MGCECRRVFFVSESLCSFALNSVFAQVSSWTQSRVVEADVFIIALMMEFIVKIYWAVAEM